MKKKKINKQIKNIIFFINFCTKNIADWTEYKKAQTKPKKIRKADNKIIENQNYLDELLAELKPLYDAIK